MAGVGASLSSKREMITAAMALTLLWVSADLIRLQISSLNETGLKCFAALVREGEEKRLSGISYYLIGATVAVIVFPRDIALLAILFLGFGDPVAALVGLKFGRHPSASPLKTWEGTFGCFVACFLITLAASFLLPTFESLRLADRVLLALIGGVSATVGELLPLQTDDNLSMPIISGALFWLVASLFNFVPGLYDL